MSNLKLKLKKVDPVKYGVIIGATMALLTFVMLLLVFLFTSLLGLGLAGLGGGSSYGMLGALGGGFVGVIIGPILYFIFGFIFGWIGTVLLNFILSKTGGLDIEFENTGLDIQRIGEE